MGRKMMSYEVGGQFSFVVMTTSYSKPSLVAPVTQSSRPFMGPWLVFEEPAFEEPPPPHERVFKLTVDGIEEIYFPRSSYIGSFVVSHIVRHVFEVIS